MVMESTYGDRVHGNIEQMHDDLERVIREGVARGGKIIVPAFAVGRTQELLYALHELKGQGRLPPLRIFVDSPLAINVTEVFKLHSECFDTETRAFLEAHGDVFAFEGVELVTSREDSMRLNHIEGPAMIISAAGMAEAGRVLHHLRNNVENEKSTILIVGFMAQHTLGRRIAERQPRVRIWGVERDLRAHVEVLDSFSAHADRNDLLAFAGASGSATRQFFLVHGEHQSQASLKAAMAERSLRVSVPNRGETVDLL
jgi:metallo-beta-lactamase family protein